MNMNKSEPMDVDTSVFVRVFKPVEDEPGGNIAVAITGAMAVALIGTIAWDRIDSEYVSISDDDCQKIKTQAQALSARLFMDAQNDLQAHKQIQRAYALPESTAEEQTIRTQAIQAAIIRATRVSLSIARHCVQALDLISDAPYHPDYNFSTDVTVAKYLVIAGLQAAIEKAKIHINAIHDDETAIECGSEIQSLIGEIPDPYTWERGTS